DLAAAALFILLVPRPDTAHQLIAAVVMAALPLFLAQPALDDGLGTDAGVIRAGYPQGVITLHTPPADQYVLERVIQSVPHMQRPGHIRRRNDDAERFAFAIRPAVEVAVLTPKLQPTLL